MMLVPHEPDADPRIEWVSRLCGEIAPTVVVAATWPGSKPLREIRGDTYIERVSIGEALPPWLYRATQLGTRLFETRLVREYGAQRQAPPEDPIRHGTRAVVVRGAGAPVRFAAAWAFYTKIVSALYRRARAESVRPAAIVCHDLFGLMAGVRAKRHLGSPLLYDSHEYWPQADLLGEAWEERVTTSIERRLIRRADRVVSVSPPLARHLERLYGIDDVLAVPNAEPRARRPAEPAAPRRPVRFLLQGQVARGRGIERLLASWAELDEPEAVLYLRCPPNDFSAELVERFGRPIDAGRIVVAPPVGEHELVAAAAEADVGVIPYVGPNLNHVYACPNKLSQYMQAGLAILASDEMLYVSELVERFECGRAYSPREPRSLHEQVRTLVREPERLVALKRNAVTAAEREYNWETVSRPYHDALEGLVRNGAPVS
jgi:glycosyltransferase involved in cell wall biosynthesis